MSGLGNNLEVFGGYSVAPAPAAIEEFKLEDGNNSAEFGHSVAAIVNAVVKSGTNKNRASISAMENGASIITSVSAGRR